MGDAKAGGFAAEKMSFPFFCEFSFCIIFLLIIFSAIFFYHCALLNIRFSVAGRGVLRRGGCLAALFTRLTKFRIMYLKDIGR